MSSFQRAANAMVGLAVVMFLGGACVELPDEAPPLADMEEPLTLLQSPDDEEARLSLPKGSFTGLTVGDGRTRLDELEEEPEGVLVASVIENSPGDAAGLEVGDLLFEVEGPAPVGYRELLWPSEWRQVELDAEPGVELKLRYDRAGAERETVVTPIPRVRSADAPEAERFREEQHIGVVLRTATEVEARSAGLGPGGGAVVVGLSRNSPWRPAGVLFEDMIVEIQEKPVAHPQVVLEQIRKAGEERGTLRFRVARGDETLDLESKTSVRFEEVYDLNIPLLYSYESRGGRTSHSVLFGLFGHESTEVAVEWKFLWLISISGGQSDRLVEIER